MRKTGLFFISHPLLFITFSANPNYIFHRWVKILRDLLPASVLEQVKKNDDTRAWVLEILKDVELIVDSYEQPIQRPMDNEEQKRNYSGKHS